MYQKSNYDNLFKNVIPNSVAGIKIFNAYESYIISQKYDEVTNLENRIWSELFQNLEFELDRYASREYLLGLRSLPIPNNMFPNFNEISPLIENSTGWSLLPVAGFLDEELFFEINTKRQFPVTDIIRKSPRFDQKYSGVQIANDAGYTRLCLKDYLLPFKYPLTQSYKPKNSSCPLLPKDFGHQYQIKRNHSYKTNNHNLNIYVRCSFNS